MPFNIGPGELIILLIIALVVFGPGRLPEVGQALGKSIREFRRAASDITESTNPNPAPSTPASTPGTQPPTASPSPAAAPPAAPTASGEISSGSGSDGDRPSA
jgi:sec-independent protein translocase protein TatA